MRLEFACGGRTWSILCDTERAPRTLQSLAAILPCELQLHTPKIAGLHVYWHAPLIEDAEGAIDVMEAQPGSFIYWPARQFLELTFAPLQAETATITLLGAIESGLPELYDLGLSLRQSHGRSVTSGRLSAISDVPPAADAPRGEPVALDLIEHREALWRGRPAEFAALLASRAIMHPAGPLMMAEAEARNLHELLWWVRADLSATKEEFSRHMAAVACNKAATRLRDFCHLAQTAALFLKFERAFRDGAADLRAHLNEAILCAGRVAAWLDLEIPWHDVNEAMRKAIDDRTVPQ
ncbi:MAG TPA: hypothetical protein VEA41_18755 [Salinarimonas sp.]|nr:hypothetical protein [Salinarimonas sp.]